MIGASRHPPSPHTTRLDIRLKRSLHPICQRTRPWLQRQAASRPIYVCATDIQRMLGVGGLEPPASPFSGVRSNHLSYGPSIASARMVEPVGIEPTTPCLQSRCSPS